MLTPIVSVNEFINRCAEIQELERIDKLTHINLYFLPDKILRNKGEFIFRPVYAEAFRSLPDCKYRTPPIDLDLLDRVFGDGFGVAVKLTKLREPDLSKPLNRIRIAFDTSEFNGHKFHWHAVYGVGLLNSAYRKAYELNKDKDSFKR